MYVRGEVIICGGAPSSCRPPLVRSCCGLRSEVRLFLPLKVGKVFACGARLAANLTRTRWDLLYSPMQKALARMRTNREELQSISAEVKDRVMKGHDPERSSTSHFNLETPMLQPYCNSNFVKLA